jgi:hypothetical protein
MSKSFDYKFFTVFFYELITAGFSPMNLKYEQCFGRKIICFNFIDWAKNRQMLFLVSECHTNFKSKYAQLTQKVKYGEENRYS